MTDRRGFLGFAGAALAGSFLVRDPQPLVVPEHKIVLATEIPPEPLGHVLFDWARVTVRETHVEDIVRGRSTALHVRIEGYVDELERKQAFFLAAEHDERLKIYFTGVA